MIGTELGHHRLPNLPCSTTRRWGEYDRIERPRLEARQPSFLGCSVEQVMLKASDEDVDLKDMEAVPVFLAELPELVAD